MSERIIEFGPRKIKKMNEAATKFHRINSVMCFTLGAFAGVVGGHVLDRLEASKPPLSPEQWEWKMSLASHTPVRPFQELTSARCAETLGALDEYNGRFDVDINEGEFYCTAENLSDLHQAVHYVSYYLDQPKEGWRDTELIINNSDK